MAARKASLVVDRVSCDGHGVCAELFPERISLDRWGYPVVTDDVPDSLYGLAHLAVENCPRLALHLLEHSQ